MISCGFSDLHVSHFHGSDFPLEQAVHKLRICYGGDLQKKENKWYQRTNSAQDCYVQQAYLTTVLCSLRIMNTF